MYHKVDNLDSYLIYLLLLRKKKNCLFRCNCVEPEHPSNKTLQYWQDYNISASDVPWGNLTVSVSKFWNLINKGIGVNNFVYLTAANILKRIPFS